MIRSYEAASTESLAIWGVVSSPSSRGGPDMSSETALTGSDHPRRVPVTICKMQTHFRAFYFNNWMEWKTKKHYNFFCRGGQKIFRGGRAPLAPP